MREYATPQSTDLQADWRSILDRCGVQYLALDISADRDLVQLFRPDPQWVVYLDDGEGLILARTDHDNIGLRSEREVLLCDSTDAADQVPRLDRAEDDSCCTDERG